MNIANVKEILKQYNTNKEEISNMEETKEILDILYENKIININTNGKIKKKNTNNVYAGKLQKKENFGFVVVDEVSDFYVKNIEKYMDGDEVLIILTEVKGKSETAKILGLINRKNGYLVVKKEAGNKFSVINNSSNDFMKIQIVGLDYEQIRTGTILSLNVKEIKKNKVITTLNNIIADENDPDLEMKLILDKYDIDVEFSDIEDELSSVEDEIEASEIEGRIDLRDQIFFTIDGSDSKDLDDAVSLMKTNDGYSLYVSIADVSHYIKENTKLDENARSRATSVYFIDRVVPMLPKKISNGICSLHAQVDRLTMTCEIKIDNLGNIEGIKVYESIINSRYRLTYSEVNNILVRNDASLIKKYADIYGILKEMDKLSKILNKKRLDAGSFNLEDTEAKFKLDEDQNIIKIFPVIRERGERLIEEFMILANEAVTLYANQNEVPFIYRIHGHPNPNKLQGLKDLLTHLNINTNIDYNNIDPKDFKDIFDQVDNPTFRRVLSKMIVRSMQKAVYSTENIGHFGLALENYTHFTSPIRRYPDLEVHRVLKSIIKKDKDIKGNELEIICKHSSEKEVNAIKAEQEIEDRKKAQYMKNYIGHIFKGTITNIEDYGFFVELDNTIRGLVPFREVAEYKEHNPYKITFFNDTSLNIGEQISVEVVGVNLERGLVDFFIQGFTRVEKNKENTNRFKNKKRYKKDDDGIKKSNNKKRPKKSNGDNKNTKSKKRYQDENNDNKRSKKRRRRNK